MREISVFNSVTLDGVMQAPGGPDEDRRSGFERGGWAGAGLRPSSLPGQWFASRATARRQRHDHYRRGDRDLPDAVLRLKDGDVLITDGPFAEGKEHIGGFTIIEVPDLDAALRWGRRMAEVITLPIEVRPFQGED